MNIRNKCLVILVFLVLSLTFVPISSFATNPYTVRGYVYVNGIIQEPEGVQLIFPEQTIDATLYSDGYYLIDFYEYIGTSGTFDVTVSGEIYATEETITVIQGIFAYKINLSVTIEEPVNNPPNKPINPNPKNNSENTSINPELGVLVSDPDGDSLTVRFYNASNDELIDTKTGVTNNTVAKITWNDLAYNTIYSWYAIANDSALETKSDEFTFKTREKDTVSPSISFEKPELDTLYILDFGLPLRLLRYPFIIGRLTIKIDAEDGESGVDYVDLTIKGRFSEKTETLAEEPYEYLWNSLSFGKYNLTAVAYDTDGNSASAMILVRKFL